MGFWGFRHGMGIFRYALALAVPLVAAGLWVTFAVPNDPSRSGAAPVAVHGMLRLILEALFFGFAVWGLIDTARFGLAVILGAAVLIHYAVSYDRIEWLLRT